MADQYIITNYSNGWVVERVPAGQEACSSWILLPAENLWSVGLRAFLYILALLYMFVGIAIVSDVFMGSIEVITSKKRKVVRWDEEKQERVEREVLIWNETVANLTLMALGSSAPEILLAVMETVINLGVQSEQDGLGTFTIIGSAAFNLLIITAICIISIPSPTSKRIRELGVFALTSFWSIFAYVWMLLALQVISVGVIEPWEAFVTLAFFPIMVLTAYCQDNGWWCQQCCSSTVNTESQLNVRVITTERRKSTIHGMARELVALEHEKARSHANLKAASEESEDPAKHCRDSGDGDSSSMGSQAKLMRTRRTSTVEQSFTRARFRFRHAAVRSLMGNKKHLNHRTKMADVVEVVHNKPGMITMSAEELCGKFTFSAPSYSVLESAGILEIDVLFHRTIASAAKRLNLLNGSMNHTGNGVVNGKKTETAFQNPQVQYKDVVTVEYETREGSAKIDKDFTYTQGTLVFKETEYVKTITVPIINDNQYEADVDFYVLLKNPTGAGGLGEPSIARVTIIDDDEPGEFSFEEQHYYADLTMGTVSATVLRQCGCDGTVSLEYSTMDGTAKGGDKVGENADYKTTSGVLEFKHGETSKQISIVVNKKAQGNKNFIIALRNPSLGAKIGSHSATVASITRDELGDRIADVLADEEEEEETWGSQFRGAMVLSPEEDEDGNEVPLKWYDYLLHFITFPFKVLFACIPPRKYLGAWPTFVVSIAFIGGLTAVVETLGKLLGCVVNLRASVAGITIVALGTSLPDTFASRTAALHDEYADAAIGNINGSNSVNVFLGLGLPWVISSMYYLARNQPFKVPTGNLVQSVIIFSICGSICIIMLLLRRKFAGGELGGKVQTKVISGIFLVVLWLIYIVLTSLAAYHPGIFPW